MGLGQLFARNMDYHVTNTVTNETGDFTIITGHDGAFPEWSHGRYRGAMALPAAWSAALLISDKLGSLPWHAYREGPDGVPLRMSPQPVVLHQPAPPETRMNTFSGWTLDLLWHGNAIGVITSRNWAGWPTTVAPVPADWVQVRYVDEQDSWPLPIGEVVYYIAGVPYSWRDVLHVKGPCEPGSLRGMGLLEAHQWGSLKLAGDLGEQAGGVADSAVPSILIKDLNPDVTAGEAESLKSAWMTAQRTRRPMVVGPTVDATPLAWNPSETQLLDARKYSDVQIAQIFQLDPAWLGAAQTSRTYSNIEQDSIVLMRRTLGGHIARFEQALTAMLPGGAISVRADLSAELRPDTLTRYQAHQIAISTGFKTANEARAEELLPPLTPEQKAELAPPAPAEPAGGPRKLKSVA